MKVEKFILHPLDDAINWQHLNIHYQKIIHISNWWRWRWWWRWEYRIFIEIYENESLKVLPYVEETTKLSKKEPIKKSANKPKIASIFPGASISKKEPSKISDNKPKRLYNFPGAPTLFINKAIKIYVFYRPWNQHFTIWVIYMHQNKSLGVGKSLFCTFIIKDECNSSVILFWYIKNKTKKKTQLSYWVMAYIRAIWYI